MSRNVCFYYAPIAAELDTICAQDTGFKAFDDLINAAGGYRPSLYTRPFDRSRAEKARAARAYTLAEAYDVTMLANRDERRAYRGN